MTGSHSTVVQTANEVKFNAHVGALLSCREVPERFQKIVSRSWCIVQEALRALDFLRCFCERDTTNRSKILLRSTAWRVTQQKGHVKRYHVFDGKCCRRYVSLAEHLTSPYIKIMWRARGGCYLTLLNPWEFTFVCVCMMFKWLELK